MLKVIDVKLRVLIDDLEDEIRDDKILIETRSDENGNFILDVHDATILSVAVIDKKII